MKAVGLLGSLRGYQTSWLRGDVLAGLTVWAVLVPESLAYATIAGVPPVVGLYASAPALVLYAALGGAALGIWPGLVANFIRLRRRGQDEVTGVGRWR